MADGEVAALVGALGLRHDHASAHHRRPRSRLSGTPSGWRTHCRLGMVFQEPRLCALAQRRGERNAVRPGCD